MKKVLFTTLLVATFPAFAAPASCDEYTKQMEETLKKEGSYSEEAMKIVKDQIATVSADQQEAFCKAAIESMKASANDTSSDKEEAEEDEENKAKG
ncbi:MAG: cell surface protein [Cardiobacteriaceae bacterium]|nr:cell surface protein [Cardiobacteriaceae bacterium]